MGPIEGRHLLISFNALRSLELPGVRYIKADHYLQSLDSVREADWVLFPEYWQVNSLAYGLKRRLFPNLATYHIGHNKIEQTRAFMTVAPEAVPWTEILPSIPSAIEQVLETFCFPFVTKVVKSSMGQGVRLVNNRREFLRYAEENAVLYVQEYLPIHRDLRVVWIGREIVTAYWREQTNGFHTNVAQGGIVTFDAIPPAALELVHKVATGLGIDHAGFDVAVVQEKCYLLEFNVMFGTDGLIRQGIRLGDYIARYLGLDDDKPRTPPLKGRVAA